VAGVRQANVNHTTGVASVVYEPACVGSADLLARIRKVGYTPGSARIRLTIKGMTCASRVSAVEQALRATPGVVTAEVNPATAQADVEYLPQTVTFQGLQEAVADSGYEAVAPLLSSEEGVSQEEAERHQEYRTLMRKFWFAAIISILIMAFSYPDLFPGLREWMPMGSLERRLVWSLLGVLTLPVMLWAGSQFYTGMWAALKHRSANMHTLIAFGISAAFLYSVVAVAFPQGFPSRRWPRCFGM
jgi:Cu+-exporting ATPase